VPLFDASTDEIVVRIVYDGLGTAGKTTNLRMLHAAFTARARGGVETFEENAAGRTLYFDWLELHAGHVDAWPLRCQIVSVPGQFVYASRRFQLLQDIDGAVLVCDSTPHGVRAGGIAMGFLVSALESSGHAGIPIVLQANKQDLADALSPERVAESMPVAPRAVVAASATSSDGVRATLLRVLDLVRADVRARLLGRDARELAPLQSTARDLYEALIASEGKETPAFEAALELALEQVR
jgi:signal recognition particle receptor subunit beta